MDPLDGPMVVQGHGFGNLQGIKLKLRTKVSYSALLLENGELGRVNNNT